MEYKDLIPIGISVIALLLATFTFLLQARMSALQTMFSVFAEAGKIGIERPEVTCDVLGINVTQDDAEDEMRKIAYLGLLLHAFNEHYQQRYCPTPWRSGKSFSRMENDCRRQRTFLNQLLSLEKNQERWEKIRARMFAEFDEGFVQAIDNLIAFEKARKTEGSSRKGSNTGVIG